MENPPNHAEGVSIGALAARTCVPVDTLRAWERRYGVLRPWRTGGGQRRYGAADIERVLWLAARVAEGQRISEAVSGLTAVAAREAGAETLPVDSLISRISASARLGDAPRMEGELDRAFAALPFAQTMELVVFPALADLGRRWALGETGESLVASEHLLSGAVERRLAGYLAAARRTRGPIAVIACPSGERHAIGGFALAVIMARDGWQVMFLGADTPLDQANAFASERRAWICIASCTMPGTAERAAAEIAELPGTRRWVLAGPDAPMPSDTDLGVWGPDLQSARDSAAKRAAEAA
ncbi:MAG: MerR family transcriptional regulator [Miltoncostaeaceae bacterium]